MSYWELFRTWVRSCEHISITINNDENLRISANYFSGIITVNNYGVKMFCLNSESYLMIESSRTTYFIWFKSLVSHLSISLTATFVFVSLWAAFTTYPPEPSPRIASSLYLSLMSLHTLFNLFIMFVFFMLINY